MNEPQNEPAFPHAPYSADAKRWSDGGPGLTKRELFAIKALTVVAPAAIDFDYSDRDGCYYVAKQACQMADALLAALNQQPEATLPEHKEVR